MEALDYWKLCDRVTVFQATMLIIGRDLENLRSQDVERNGWGTERKLDVPEGYGAVQTALLVAIRQGLVDVEIVERREFDQNGGDMGAIDGTVDLDASFISTLSIRQFLKERNFPSDFFTPDLGEFSPDYLNPENSCYAPKLAAAVEAWTAVTAERKFEIESTPKQLMEKWLRENAVRFSLNKTDGKLNEDGIAQITKIANWRPEGGASKSPGSKNPPTPRKAQ